MDRKIYAVEVTPAKMTRPWNPLPLVALVLGRYLVGERFQNLDQRLDAGKTCPLPPLA